MIRKATLWSRFLVWADFRERWREYYCFNSSNHYLAPERYYNDLNVLVCPHCGDELTWTEKLAGPEDYAL